MFEQNRLITIFGSHEENGSLNLLLELFGEVLAQVININGSIVSKLSIDDLHNILNLPMLKTIVRVSVLNEDETIQYIIPEEDIIAGSLTYNENYQNGNRRSFNIKLPNIPKWKNSQHSPYTRERRHNEPFLANQSEYPYMPHQGGIWYGTKMSLDIGVEVYGQRYYFRKGTYIVTAFELNKSNSDRCVSYTLQDKFCNFSGNVGVVDTGYEIPVEQPIETCIQDILNMSCSDNTIYDCKEALIDSSLTGRVTQQTIRIDPGGKIADLFNLLCTQMGAEYYYNSTGNLCLVPLDESMNDISKPILWSYNDVDIDQLQINAGDNVVNVVDVKNTGVDGNLYTAVSKNENLQSPINIFSIKERRTSPVTNETLISDDQAQEVADYYLRSHTIYLLSLHIKVPFNPILTVNNIIEINDPEYQMHGTQWLIKGISYTAGEESMQLEVTALNYMPFMSKGVNFNGRTK